jgi:hypothetical protein
MENVTNRTNAVELDAELDADLAYTIGPARYAKGMLAVRPHPDGTGWKTLAALIISQMPGVRWTGRDRAYLCSPSRAGKFEQEVQEARERRAKARADEQAREQAEPGAMNGT